MPTKVFVNRKIDLSLGTASRVLNPGEHLLSDEEMALWFIPGLLAAGDISLSVPGDPAAQPVLSYTRDLDRVMQTEDGPKKIEEASDEGDEGTTAEAAQAGEGEVEGEGAVGATEESGTKKSDRKLSRRGNK